MINILFIILSLWLTITAGDYLSIFLIWYLRELKEFDAITAYITDKQIKKSFKINFSHNLLKYQKMFLSIITFFEKLPKDKQKHYIVIQQQSSYIIHVLNRMIKNSMEHDFSVKTQRIWLEYIKQKLPPLIVFMMAQSINEKERCILLTTDFNNVELVSKKEYENMRSFLVDIIGECDFNKLNSLKPDFFKKKLRYEKSQKNNLVG